MNTLYIVLQSFRENSGSFSGFFENMAKYASKRGYNVKIICGKKRKEEKSQEVKTYGEIVRFSNLDFPFFSNVFRAILLSYKIKKYFSLNIPKKEDIIVANGEAALGLIKQKFIIRAGDQPVLIFLKNMEIAKKEVSFLTRIMRFFHMHLLFLLERTYYRKAEGVIYSSEETRKLYEEGYKVKKPYFIPHTSISIKKAQPTKKKKTSNEKIILFVSANEEKIRKGIIYLERILPELFSSYPNVKLLHIGEKIEWQIPEEYKKSIISLGRVPWNKMIDYYVNADMLVSCSLHEMFPNTIIEALAASLPVVSSDIQGVNEYILHKKNGYIYKRGDTEELKKGIYFLLEHPELKKKSRKYSFSKLKNLNTSFYFDCLFRFIKNKQPNNLLTKK